MADYNKVILVGRLTRDPQIRFFSNENAVAEMGLAVGRRWRDKKSNEMKEETTFVDVECFGRTAELVGQYLTKGRQCLIDGRLKLDQWEDKDGAKRSKLKVIAEAVQFLDGHGDGQERQTKPQSAPEGRRAAPRTAPRETRYDPGPTARSEDMDDEPPF